MSYRQIKWLILIIPTLTIGLWEYMRHQFFLPYISMELGNWLAPLIVFSVSILFLTQLFSILEKIQEELNAARGLKATLEEREKMARELHDGIAQSLFLLSVQIDQIEKQQTGDSEYTGGLRKTVQQVNEYVRQAIANLRYSPTPVSIPWMESLHKLNGDFTADTGIKVSLDWTLPERLLSTKEKVELYISIREALLNIRKHTNADQVWIVGKENNQGWTCLVIDNGQGFADNPFQIENKYGLSIMKDRAMEMGWEITMLREKNKTILEIGKEGITI